jgi:hypothetical protein
VFPIRLRLVVVLVGVVPGLAGLHALAKVLEVLCELRGVSGLLLLAGMALELASRALVSAVEARTLGRIWYRIWYPPEVISAI